jgi:voltage-gated potassium channel
MTSGGREIALGDRAAWLTAKSFERGRLTAFVQRHDVAWEFGMAVLAVIYLAIGFLVDEGKGVSSFALGGLALVFFTEFSARLIDAPSRKLYLRQHWIDLVSCIPLVGGLRSIRILRLIRLGAALRLFVLAEHEAEAHHRDRQSMWFVGPMLILIWLGSATAYWSLEHGVNPTLHNFGDALYWAFITATTVGYGDVTPVTPEGRVVAGILIFVGIGMVGFASAQITQRLLRSKEPDTAALLAKLEQIDQRLQRIEGSARG